ncbi:MAG: hypothetical protein RLZZ609_332 [Cyanobacteriota bacterium]|jgi:hypothetical protein
MDAPGNARGIKPAHRTLTGKGLAPLAEDKSADKGDEIGNHFQGGSGSTIGRMQNIAAARIECAIGANHPTNPTLKTLHACYYLIISFSHENQV